MPIFMGYIQRAELYIGEWGQFKKKKKNTQVHIYIRNFGTFRIWPHEEKENTKSVVNITKIIMMSFLRYRIKFYTEAIESYYTMEQQRILCKLHLKNIHINFRKTNLLNIMLLLRFFSSIITIFVEYHSIWCFSLLWLFNFFFFKWNIVLRNCYVYN